MKLYPGWKEAVTHIIDHDPGWFVSDQQISEWLEKEKGTDPFNLDLMRLRDALLWHHDIHLKRAEQDGIKGYVIASDQEKVDGYIESLQDRIRSTLKRQAQVIQGVIPENLDENGARKYEHQIRRSGFQLAFHAVLESSAKKLTNTLTFTLDSGNKKKE